jgi:predicted DCC family thiol-disulfide oxidoreductase YuxK
MYKNQSWPLTLYFDGKCPLCAREIKLLGAKASPQRLLFVDISQKDFDSKSLGLSLEEMESLLHARFEDGTWVKGLDATLWSWRAAGLEAFVAPLTWPAFRPILNIAYRAFCRWRPFMAWLPHPDGSRRCYESSCVVTKDVPSSESRLSQSRRKT